MKPKYIKDAIIWNRHAAENGAWVRVSDINYIESEDVFTPAIHYGLGRFIIRQAYPYEDWMEEYIGTNKKLTDDERFKCDYKF